MDSQSTPEERYNIGEVMLPRIRGQGQTQADMDLHRRSTRHISSRGPQGRVLEGKAGSSRVRPNDPAPGTYSMTCFGLQKEPERRDTPVAFIQNSNQLRSGPDPARIA